jgi:hypothetical protein
MSFIYYLLCYRLWSTARVPALVPLSAESQLRFLVKGWLLIGSKVRGRGGRIMVGRVAWLFSVFILL